MGEKETGEFITHLVKMKRSPHQRKTKLYVKSYSYIRMH